MKIDVPNLGDNPLVPNTLIDYEVDQNTQCITGKWRYKYTALVHVEELAAIQSYTFMLE